MTGDKTNNLEGVYFDILAFGIPDLDTNEISELRGVAGELTQKVEIKMKHPATHQLLRTWQG